MRRLELLLTTLVDPTEVVSEPVSLLLNSVIGLEQNHLASFLQNRKIEHIFIYRAVIYDEILYINLKFKSLVLMLRIKLPCFNYF